MFFWHWNFFIFHVSFSVDPLEISEAALVEGTDWDDKDYSVMASVMDGVS